jgi:hypothetical protein
MMYKDKWNKFKEWFNTPTKSNKGTDVLTLIVFTLVIIEELVN